MKLITNFYSTGIPKVQKPNIMDNLVIILSQPFLYRIRWHVLLHCPGHQLALLHISGHVKQHKIKCNSAGENKSKLHNEH